MNARKTIAELLRDAEHIAKANNFVILAYLIEMALECTNNDLDANSNEKKAG